MVPDSFPKTFLSKVFSSLLLILVIASCGPTKKLNYSLPAETTVKTKIKTEKFQTGADNVESYFKLIENKKVGIVTNQTGLITYDSIFKDGLYKEGLAIKTEHIVDYLVKQKDVELVKIYAPEHGFRGTASNGELISDGKDTKTGLPILSLYGNSKKPSPKQLEGIDVLMFDLQDVGARFYTYISHLHYIMEACAEQKIPLIILDRPNPNGGIVDGPILEKEHSSFIGMHTIPVLHGMTIGEYALMINGEGWLANGIQCELKIVPCENYKREMPYSLPVKPSPNLPNDQSINLYASLCFFEGTNISLGRGTDMQFQVYGSPYLPYSGFSFVPEPNVGSSNPPLKGMTCYGEDLRNVEKVTRLELKWLIKAYQENLDKPKFFTPFFTKLAGNKTLQFQIQAGMPEEQIRESWVLGLEEFKIMRQKYLIY
ncbi:exo-beta-N-acetylmuramidase NamZ domain-containing protein [Flavobacterium sp. PLA-1-15]|uniref:exo-beta-N-acetylmuramidase NamZ family protein n=1 Tax=Flavobacterium sp. PLA-1-15 TaxID=3380533 RepID=UPI003B762C85